MYFSYLSDNSIKDYNYINNSINISITPYTGDLNQYFNFSGNFDQTSAGQYISSITDDFFGNISVTQSACSNNCSNCNSLECLACSTGYYLEDGICKNTTGSAYYFLSPAYDSSSNAPVDLPLSSQSAITTKVTVSFFIKFYANSSNLSTIDIFRYSSKLILKMVYTSSDAKLQLYSDSGMIADAGSFISRFGLWTHISLAYYYDSAKIAYFPAMLNFQVNFSGIATDYQYYKGDLGISPLNLVIPKEPIALYANIWVWNLYYTGSWAFMSYASNPAPLIKFIDTQNSATCLTIAGYKINCYMDYNSLLISTNYCANPSFYNGTSCLTAQTSCPYGFYNSSSTSCSCDNKVKDMWINQSDTKHYCTSNYSIYF